MKKIKPKCFLIYLDIYPINVIFSINQSDIQLEKSISKIWGGTPLTSEDKSCILDKGDSNGRCIVLPDNDILIRLTLDDKNSRIHQTIAHEVFHATTFIMYKIGASFEINVSDEPYAYLLGFITGEIYRKLKL